MKVGLTLYSLKKVVIDSDLKVSLTLEFIAADKRRTETPAAFTNTREQAITDGQLIDVSDTPEAKEAGFRVPVCLTVGVHALVQVPESLSGWQDYSGRLGDTLFLAAAAFKRAGEKRLVPFEVVFQADPRRSATVKLWFCFSEHEGFTVLLPEEY